MMYDRNKRQLQPNGRKVSMWIIRNRNIVGKLRAYLNIVWYNSPWQLLNENSSYFFYFCLFKYKMRCMSWAWQYHWMLNVFFFFFRFILGNVQFLMVFIKCLYDKSLITVKRMFSLLKGFCFCWNFIQSDDWPSLKSRNSFSFLLLLNLNRIVF